MPPDATAAASARGFGVNGPGRGAGHVCLAVAHLMVTDMLGPYSDALIPVVYR